MPNDKKIKIQVENLLFRINKNKTREILNFISDRCEDIPEFGCPEIPDYEIPQAKWINGKGWELPK